MIAGDECPNLELTAGANIGKTLTSGVSAGLSSLGGVVSGAMSMVGSLISGFDPRRHQGAATRATRSTPAGLP